MNELTHISLFTGIGGIDLAAEWAGFKTILMVEIDPFCQRVLKKHWPDVPIIGDIKDVKGKEYKGTVTIVTGGYPCQGESTAGKRRGQEDDRWLWPEMDRLLSEIRPTWVVAENVAGHITLGLTSVLNDLEAQGYQTQALVIPACAVGAWQRRDRVFVVAYLNETRYRFEGNTRQRISGDKARLENKSGTEVVSDFDKERCEERWWPQPINERPGWSELERGDWWSLEPGVVRMVHGASQGMDRSRVAAMGESVVPQQIYPILQAIADIERTKQNSPFVGR